MERTALHIITNVDITEYLTENEFPAVTSLAVPQPQQGTITSYFHRRARRNDLLDAGNDEGDGNNDHGGQEDNNAEASTSRGQCDGPEETIEAGGTTDLDDEISCTAAPGGKRLRLPVANRTPWKFISHHTNTRQNHYHLIYVSSAKTWGHNSRLGKAIRNAQYKCGKITCIYCLLEYLTPGNDRQTLRDFLTQDDKTSFQCVHHSLGLNVKGQKSQEYNSTSANSERRNSILPQQSTTSNEGLGTVDATDIGSHEDLYTDDGVRRVEHPQIQPTSSVQQGEPSNYGLTTRGRFAEYHKGNNELVILLCKNGAFNEAEAQRAMCATPQGIALQFTKKFEERLRTAICISRILVFQEPAEQRLQRAKELQLRTNDRASEPEEIQKLLRQLKHTLIMNDIDYRGFAKITHDHFYGLTKKKNNLFFIGPPSTGKTMIMESLVELHFNYERLTGLTPGSSFNFSSLIHSNACFMDECRLTDNQFEQWKLLAARQPMCTDIKYKNRTSVTDCILYTASNYPIEMYVQAPDAKAAIEARTNQYHFRYITEDYYKMTAFAWEQFWKDHIIQEPEFT